MKRNDRNFLLERLRQYYALTKKPITLDMIVTIIEPYFQWDEERAYENELKKTARNLIKMAKDEEGIREAISFNMANKGESQQMAWAFVDLTNDTNILDRQKKQLLAKRIGIDNSIKKVENQKFIVEKQTTIFQHFEEMDRKRKLRRNKGKRGNANA